MSLQYVTVHWNRHKRVYDVVAGLAVLLLIAGFVLVSVVRLPAGEQVSPPILAIRAFGIAAIVLLHVVLLIGPLARLDERFAPLLYNRRHLGVMLFCLGGLHGVAAIGFYGAFGNTDPLSALLASPTDVTRLSAFPFELLGFAALVILFVMAATSHDFWLANLGPRLWKTLHVGVHLAWALVIGHVALGVMQSEPSSVVPGLLGAGVLLVGGVHVAAAVRQRSRERSETAAVGEGGWVDVGDVADIPDGGAVTVRPSSGAAAIAVFRDGGVVHAVANQCAHQGGPLGEGRLIDGCITCPWHGYQYRPGDGCSPPPYTERVPVHEVRVIAGRVSVSLSGATDRDDDRDEGADR